MDLLEIRKKAKGRKAAQDGEQAAPGPDAGVEARDTETASEAPEARPSGGTAKKAGPKRRRAAVKKPRPTPVSHVEDASPKEDAQEASAPVGVREPPVKGEAGPPEAETPEAPEDLYGDIPGAVSSDENIVEYLAFMLANEEYSVKVEDVREIIRLQSITAVPRAPGFVKGIMSLRGVVIPVFDIKKRLGLGESEKTRSARIIVVSDGGELQGMVVDKVTGVVRLPVDKVEPPPAVIGGVEAEYLAGVGRVGERLLILFNTGKVLAMEG